MYRSSREGNANGYCGLRAGLGAYWLQFDRAKVCGAGSPSSHAAPTHVYLSVCLVYLRQVEHTRGVQTLVSRARTKCSRLSQLHAHLVQGRAEVLPGRAVPQRLQLAGIRLRIRPSGVWEWVRLVSWLLDDRWCSGEPQDTCSSALELSKVQIVPGNDRGTENETQIDTAVADPLTCSTSKTGDASSETFPESSHTCVLRETGFERTTGGRRFFLSLPNSKVVDVTSRARREQTREKTQVRGESRAETVLSPATDGWMPLRLQQAPVWREFAPRVYEQYPSLLAEMYAYCMAPNPAPLLSLSLSLGLSSHRSLSCALESPLRTTVPLVCVS